MLDYIVVLVTAQNHESAQQMAQALLEERLIACINIIDNVQSFFCWQGNINQENEVLLVLKTTTDLYEEVEKRIKELHSYDVPEIIALPIIKGSQSYLDWLDDSTKEKG